MKSVLGVPASLTLKRPIANFYGYSTAGSHSYPAILAVCVQSDICRPKTSRRFFAPHSHVSGGLKFLSKGVR